MAFFKDQHGRLFPISRIGHIAPSSAGQGPNTSARVHLIGEEALVQIDASVVDDIERMAAQIIPAQPGFSLLACWGIDDDEAAEPWVEAQAILGWRYLADRGVEPIVLDGEFDGMKGNHGIEQPNGQIIADFGISPDRQSWITALKVRSEIVDIYQDAKQEA